MSHSRRPRSRRSGAPAHEQGFTLVEVTIILLVLVILSTIMLPQLGNYNRLARYVVVQEDLSILCSGMKKMLDEVQGNAFWGDPVSQTVPIGLLFSDGAIPGVSAAVIATDATAANWGAPLNLAVGGPLNPQVVTDGPSQVAPPQAPQQAFVADHFDNHFLVNDPLGGGGEHYPDPFGFAASMWAFGWHGPYYNDISSDPWGRRFQSNVFGLHSVPTGNIYTSAVVVLSAGPNGLVDTRFDMYYTSITKGGNAGSGYALGGDDAACVLSAGGPF